MDAATLGRYITAATQRDKLVISRALDMPYTAAIQSQDVVMLTVAIIKARREQSATSLETLLDMTDEELAGFLGIDLAEEGERLGEPASAPKPKKPSPNTSKKKRASA